VVPFGYLLDCLLMPLQRFERILLLNNNGTPVMPKAGGGFAGPTGAIDPESVDDLREGNPGMSYYYTRSQ